MSMPYSPKSLVTNSFDIINWFQWERRGSSQYTQADIDQVRNEWGKFVVNTYVHEPWSSALVAGTILIRKASFLCFSAGTLLSRTMWHVLEQYIYVYQLFDVPSRWACTRMLFLFKMLAFLFGNAPLLLLKFKVLVRLLIWWFSIFVFDGVLSIW